MKVKGLGVICSAIFGFFIGIIYESARNEIFRKDIEIKELLIDTLRKRNKQIKELKEKLEYNNILSKLKNHVEKDINNEVSSETEFKYKIKPFIIE